jgi:hypothetical protein
MIIFRKIKKNSQYQYKGGLRGFKNINWLLQTRGVKGVPPLLR